MENNKQEKYQSPVQAMFTGIADLFKKRIPVGELSKDERLDGKRVLITGSSSGLGFATAVKLAQMGAEVVMAVRSGIPEKGEQVKKRSGSENVYMHYVDLSDIRSIHHLVNELSNQYSHFDRIICNAAVVPKESRRTPQGLEEMFMVNYLSKFILINLLLERDLIKSEDNTIPRIIIVSSESHRNPKEFNWEGFGVYQSYGMKKTVELYGYYKLLLTTFVNELNRRINTSDKTRISVFSLCPGPVNSNIAREAPAIFKPLMKLIFSLFFRSPEKASEPVLYHAASKQQEGKSIDYLFLMSRKEMDHKTTEPANGRRLWESSEKLISEITH